MFNMASNAIRVFRNLRSIPIPVSANFVLSKSADSEALVPVAVETTWSQHDLTRESKSLVARTFVLDSQSGETVHATSPQPLEANRLWNIVSEQLPYLRAVVLKIPPDASKKSKGGSGEDRYLIQIWNGQRFQKSIDISAKKKHGAVYSDDGIFGSCQWSKNGGHLVYIAERFPQKTASFFASENVDDDVTPGDKYVYQEDWGEQLVGKSQPVICVLDVDSEIVSVFDDVEHHVPANISPGQVVWAPDDTGLVFVGRYQDPFRLGAQYCENRPSALFYINFKEANVTIVGHEKCAVASPRFSPDGTQLAWLESDAGGPHIQCRRLLVAKWPSREMRVILDVVRRGGADGGFPGIFALALPNSCWAADGRRIILHSQWRSRRELVCVDTSERLGSRLPLESTAGAATVLELRADWLVAILSSPSKPHYLAIARLPRIGQEDQLQWCRLKSGDVSCTIGNGIALDEINWSILRHTPNWCHPEFGAFIYESILLTPDQTCSDDKCSHPLVVFPHGGPHSAFAAEFNLFASGLVLCGYAVLMTNYRGSLGFGQDFVCSLLGHIGVQDVLDCQQAVEEVLSGTEPRLDASRVAVFGGSHGGFLATHLPSQFPHCYHAVAMRNPVTDVLGMTSSTDIPDWTYTEALATMRFAPGTVLNQTSVLAMLSCSPITLVENLIAPTLVLLGDSDRRVPPSQGLSLYRALRSRGRTARLLVYPGEDHSLSGVACEADCFVNLILWFNQHLKIVNDSD